MTSKAFCRCNSGHYFIGEFCPFDGWSSPASHELAAAVKELIVSGKPVSLAELHRSGLSPATMERTIVIAFGCDGAAFEAVAPELCVVDGEAKPLYQLAGSFK